MEEELLLQEDEESRCVVLEQLDQLPLPTGNISPQMFNVDSVMGNNLNEQMKQMDMLDIQSFDEKDFKNTLNQYKEFCIKELNQQPQNMQSNADLATDRSFIKMQNIFEKPKQSLKESPKKRTLDINPQQSFKTQQFMAVPIKTAKFNVDNRTINKGFQTIDQNNRLIDVGGGIGIISSQSQMDINTPKRKALLLKANNFGGDYGGVTKVSISGSNTLVQSSSHKPGSTTNQSQQPHYLKTKYETFQKLITNNQIKRCQLEQIMFNDRVNFQNNPLIISSQQQSYNISSKLSLKKSIRVFSQLDKRNTGKKSDHTNTNIFKSPTLLNSPKKLEQQDSNCYLNLKIQCELSSTQADEKLLLNAQSQININIQNQLQYQDDERSKSIKQNRKISASGSTSNYNIRFQQPKMMHKPGTQSKTTRVNSYHQNSLSKNGSSLYSQIPTSKTLLSEDLQHIVDEGPTKKRIFRRDIRKVISNNFPAEEDGEEGTEIGQKSISRSPPTQVQLSRKITEASSQNQPIEGFSRFFNYQSTTQNNSPLKTSYNGMFTRKLQSSYGSSRKRSIIPQQFEDKASNNLIFGPIKRGDTVSSYNTLLYNLDYTKPSQIQASGTGVRKLKINHLPQKSVFTNSYLMKGGNILNSPMKPRPSMGDDFALIHEVDNFIAQFQTTGQARDGAKKSQRNAPTIDYNQMAQYQNSNTNWQLQIQQRRKLLQSRYDNMSVEKTAQMRETLDGSNGMYRKTNGEEVIEVLV